MNQNLREIVDAFLAAYPDWTVIATDEAANYGAGLCADASADLVAFAGARRSHTSGPSANASSMTAAPSTRPQRSV